MNRAFSVILALLVALAAYGIGFDAAAQDEAEEASLAEELSATQRALAELTRAYDGLSGMLGRGSDQAVDVVQEDIENLGDWEYRIVLLSNRSPEALEAELNLLGDDRWEVFWIQPAASDVRVYLKRPSISYVSRVPLSALVRLLAGGAQ